MTEFRQFPDRGHSLTVDSGWPEVAGAALEWLEKQGVRRADCRPGVRFRTTVELGGRTATGLRVPAEIVEALGSGKKPAVRVTIGGHTYRSTVATRGGVYLLPLSGENRTAAGVAAGDEVDVDIELDDQPREVTVPDDLAAALAGTTRRGRRSSGCRTAIGSGTSWRSRARRRPRRGSAGWRRPLEMLREGAALARARASAPARGHGEGPRPRCG